MNRNIIASKVESRIVLVFFDEPGTIRVVVT